MIQQQPVQFEREYEQVVSDLRAALLRMFDELGLDPYAPQDVARRLGLNKTLTWNLSRVIRSTDGFSALPHIPGQQAMTKVLDAAAEHGASAATLDGVRSALAAFRDMTRVHVGDRTSLELVIDSMPTPGGDATENSRKLAFRGNSGLYGLQARTRLVSSMVVPNADDPTRLDVAFLSGFVGLRRLRSEVRWPIFKMRMQTQPHVQSDLWDSESPGQPRFFSKGTPPNIEVVHSNGDRDFVLMPGAVGDTAAFDCFRGEVFRAVVPRYRTQADQTGDFGASITLPCEHLILDLIVHRDLEFALRAQMMVFSTIYSPGEPDRSSNDASLLPIAQPTREIVGSPPVVASPRVPQYTQFFADMHRKLGVDPAHLRGIRVELMYPPLGSMVVLRYNLPEAPTAPSRSSPGSTEYPPAAS